MDDELGSFYADTEGEYHYFRLREKRGPDVLFVSKETEFTNSTTGQVTSKRYIRKIFEKEQDGEIVNVKGELILRCSPGRREQVKVVVHDNDSGRMHFVLQKFRGDTGNPFKSTEFYFSQDEFDELARFLGLVRFVDLSNTDNFQTSYSDIKSKVLVDRSEQELLRALRETHGEDRIRFLELIKNENLSKEDIDVLSGRKEGLETFRRKLFQDRDWGEREWQDFFERNTWIFGYGLDYRFLSILQREAALSNTDLDGTKAITGDFLLGSTDFTVMVELKRPDTALFEADRYRSRSWRLSKELLSAVSQILSQKAAWQLRSARPAYDGSGSPIEQKTEDPKCILLIGVREQFADTERNRDIKMRTFELFRRDSRNIEILTYDELFDRAHYLVNQSLPESE